MWDRDAAGPGRPTGRDLDAMFHVNPFIEEKGMVVIFNPTEKAISKQFKLPLYYTGIKNKAKLINEKEEIKQYELNSQQEIMLDVTIPAGGFSSFVVRDAFKLAIKSFCKIMWSIRKYIVLFLLLTTLASAFSQTIIHAADYGVKANSFENAAVALKRAIEACKTKNDAVLLLPGGRIDIWPEGSVKRELYISNSTEDDTLSKVKNIALHFEDCKNLTLDGNNTLVVLHGKMISFAILNSSNVTIKNIRFDYERPTMPELTIKSFADNIVEAEIHPDSKYVIDNGRIIFYGEGWKTNAHHTILFKPANNTLHYSSFKPFLENKAVQLSPFHVRFEGDFSKNRFSPGDVLTVRDPYRDNGGAFIHLSKDIQLENINMHFMHLLGIVSQLH